MLHGFKLCAKRKIFSFCGRGEAVLVPLSVFLSLCYFVPVGMCNFGVVCWVCVFLFWCGGVCFQNFKCDPEGP